MDGLASLHLEALTLMEFRSVISMCSFTVFSNYSYNTTMFLFFYSFLYAKT